MTAHPRSSRTGATHVTPFEQKGAVGLSPGELIEDVKNAVREYCAQGLDAMEGCAVESLALDTNELNIFLRGTANLYTTLQARLTQQLQTFEQYATETCLHIPAGLMPAQVTVPRVSVQCTEASEQQIDSELASLREQQIDSELASLRAQILMTQRAQRRVKQEIVQLDQELVSCGSAAQLSSIASASGQEKENLAEGASAMVTAALRLQPLLARAQKLRAKDAAVSLDSASNINAGVLAEGEIIKQESLVNSLPIGRLQMLTQALRCGPTRT